MARKRVLVLFGGPADEHSISCISAASVLRAIDRNVFEPIPVGITKQGSWIVDGEDPTQWSLQNGVLPEVVETEHSRHVTLDPSQRNCGFLADGVSLGAIDVVFPVMHGPFGEDGKVQGLLEMMGVPYVGCGVFASAACMDKHFTKVLLKNAGIPVASGITLDTRGYDRSSRFQYELEQLCQQVADANLQYPLFVKPSRAGSSFGVSKVDAPEDLAAAVYEASLHDWRVLVEQGVIAREIECAVLEDEDGTIRTSQPGEIVLDYRNAGADDAFYDFDSKYMDSQASHVQVPADLPDDMLERVRAIAARAFKAVDGAGLSRVDTFVTPAGDILVNEINTMPGFTSISMYPKAWEAAGVEYSELITHLISLAASTVR